MNDYRECQQCNGYGGWVEQKPGTMGYRGNIAPDPQFDEWVQCRRCRGTGEIPTRDDGA